MYTAAIGLLRSQDMRSAVSSILCAGAAPCREPMCISPWSICPPSIRRSSTSRATVPDTGQSRWAGFPTGSRGGSDRLGRHAPAPRVVGRAARGRGDCRYARDSRWYSTTPWRARPMTDNTRTNRCRSQGATTFMRPFREITARTGGSMLRPSIQVRSSGLRRTGRRAPSARRLC